MPRFQGGSINIQELIRHFAEMIVNEIMDDEADQMCEVSGNSRNGYRERKLATCVGTLALRVPKLRSGSFFPEDVLTRCQRTDRALVARRLAGALPAARRHLRQVPSRRPRGLNGRRHRHRLRQAWLRRISSLPSEGPARRIALAIVRCKLRLALACSPRQGLRTTSGFPASKSIRRSTIRRIHAPEASVQAW